MWELVILIPHFYQTARVILLDNKKVMISLDDMKCCRCSLVEALNPS